MRLGARTAVALYVALALHVVGVLVLLLAPPGEGPAGPGQGAGIGLRLEGPDSVLAAAPVPSTEPSPSRSEAWDQSPALTLAAPTSTAAAPERRRESAAAIRGDTRDGAADARRGGGGSERYFARLRVHLHRYRRELPADPAAARAEVSFAIRADGRADEIHLARSSGSAALDREALDLVRRAQPLPLPPGGASMSVVVPVFVQP